MKKQENVFISRIFQRFFRPLFFSSLGLSLGGVVDALVVGRSVGEEGLAAIGFTMPVFMLFNLFDVGLGLGGGIHYNRLISQGKRDRGVALFNQILQATLILSGLVAVLGSIYVDQFLYLLGLRQQAGAVYEMTSAYALILFRFAPLLFLKFVFYYFLRHDENPRQASIALVTGNVVDIVLNVLLVTLLGMGVEGAGYATVIGSGVSCVLCLPHILRKDTTLRFRWTMPSLPAVFRSFRTGFASSVQYLYQFVTLSVFNHLAVLLGGTTAVALLDVVVNMMYFASTMLDSVTGTLQPMVATFFSERSLRQVRQTLRLALGYCLVLSAVLLGLVFFFAAPICQVFGIQEPALVSTGALALRCFAVSIPFAGVNTLFAALYQSTEQERKTYLLGLLRMLILPLASGYLLALDGLSAFWCVFALYEATATLLWFGWMLVRRQDLVALPNGVEDRVYQATLSNENNDPPRVLDEIQEFCDRHGAAFSQSYYATLVVEEVCMAILENAFTGKRDEYIQVTLVARRNGDYVLNVRDNARSFNPLEMQTSRIEDGDESGIQSLGILLVKEKAKSFQYQQYYGFNTLRIVCGGNEDVKSEGGAKKMSKVKKAKKVKRSKRMMLSLGTKLTIGVLLMALVLTGFSVFISYQNYASTMDEHYKQNALNAAKTAAAYMDGDKLATYLETMTTDAEYDRMLEDLLRIKDNNDVRWIYVERMEEDGITYIIDADTPEEAYPMGSYFEYADAIVPQLESMRAGNPSEPTITNYEEFGWLVSTYYPIFESDSEVATMLVGVDISMDAVMADRHAYLLSTILGMAVASIICGVLAMVAVRRSLVRPINELSELAISFVDTQADSGVEVQTSLLDFSSGDEIEDLALAIAQMEQDTQTHIENLTEATAEREKISAELGVATQIQSSMLPCDFPNRKEFSISAFMEPAREVGGDFYDFFMLDANHLGMVIADVSGKGIPAALFMVVAKTLMKNNAYQYASPADVLSVTNAQLCENNHAEMFVTAFLCVLDLRTGMLRYANAGHNPPVIGAQGNYRFLEVKPGFVLAGMEGMRYTEGQVQMHTGDQLILYTDGVTEAQNPREELYGEQRMLDWLHREGMRYPQPAALLNGMLADVRTFAAGAEQADDITMLSVRFLNGKAGA